MELRHCGLDDCTILEHFQSSVKYFQVGRYCISDRRTKGHGPLPSYLTEGQKNMILPPNPYQREGSVDGWGKYGLRSSLLAFKTKWRKKGQKQVSPRQRLGDCSQPTFAQNGQKNYYSAHSLCHSVVVGCHSFAPFGGVSMLHPLPPRRCPGLAYQCPFRGVNPSQIPTPKPLPYKREVD